MPKKQTIWLASLLGLMVVLSAYYLMSEPVDNIATTLPEEFMEENGQGDVVMTTPQERAEEPQDSLGQTEVSFENDAGSNFFVQYRMRQEEMRGKQIEQLLNILSNTEASNEAIAEANRQLEELYELEEKQATTEEMIKMEGYEDAIVVPGENQVQVVVQAEQLDELAFLNILSIVSDNMDVPAHEVTVKVNP